MVRFGRRTCFLLVIVYLVVSLGYLYLQPSLQINDNVDAPQRTDFIAGTDLVTEPSKSEPNEDDLKQQIDEAKKETQTLEQPSNEVDLPADMRGEENLEGNLEGDLSLQEEGNNTAAGPSKRKPSPEELARLRQALDDALRKLDKNQGKKIEYPTGPETTMLPDTYQQIISTADDTCLTVVSEQSEHGCPKIKLLPCLENERTQAWKSTSRGIENFGKCIDLYTDESKIHACNCHGGGNQEWQTIHFMIQSKFKSRKCFFVDEKNVRLTHCSPLSPKQKFHYLEIEDVWSPVKIPRTPVDGPYEGIPDGGVKVNGKVSFEDKKSMLKVKEMMQFAWASYEAYAWGADEVKPLSKAPRNWVGNGMAATIIDSLDTLYIMDMKPEFEKAKTFVLENLHFENSGMVSFFETVIRALGGLLSAYGLSHDSRFVRKAQDLGDRLLYAFESPSGLPYSNIDLRSFSKTNHNWNSRQHILAEVATIQLEFKYLSELTREQKYANAAVRVMDILEGQDTRDPGLFSVFLPESTGNSAGSQEYTLGGLSDSFYEYLLKQWIQTDKTEPRYQLWYQKSASAIKKVLIKEANVGGKVYLYSGKLRNGYFEPKMEHLACFSGGMFALGLMSKATTDQDDLRIAEGLTETCQASYTSQATGLGPEKFGFEGTIVAEPGARYYILRPEYVESLFYLWRATKKRIYREWGWKVIQSLETYCRTEGGYTGLNDVTRATNLAQSDVQESFFLAETLKYLYLLYADDSLIPLDKYVFNTEAHPLPIFKPTTFE